MQVTGEESFTRIELRSMHMQQPQSAKACGVIGMAGPIKFDQALEFLYMVMSSEIVLVQILILLQTGQNRQVGLHQLSIITYL